MGSRLAAVLFASTLVLAACSSDVDEDDPSTPPTQQAAEEDSGAAEAGTGDDAEGGDAEEGTQDGDGGAADEGDGAPAQATGDAFCADAEEGAVAERRLLDATDAKSAETGKEDDSGDVAVMNDAGATMVEQIAQVRESWSAAAEHLETSTWDDSGAAVSTAQVRDAYDDFFAYLEAFALPEAELAASAGSIAEYDQGMIALVADGAVLETAASGGEALGKILGYTQERCGVLVSFAD